MKSSFGLIAQLLIAALPSAASAETIDWTRWSGSFTYGASSGTASGSAGGVGVAYSGEVVITGGVYYNSAGASHPSWQAASTFEGGIVGDGPPAYKNSINLVGGGGYDHGPIVTDAITFSKPVTNPVMAIWSLGSAGITASFAFDAPASDIRIVAGGPSAEFSNPIYASSPIWQVGNLIYGAEGNGTIEFLGTYKSISWTNPTFEDYYAVTVGVAAPEPATWALLVGGFVSLAFFARARRDRLVAKAT